MSETSYSVSETAKLLEVQTHVLRFWEEELVLPIDRNEMGHRYYTRYDIQVLLAIKELKKKGLSLKEIGSLIPFLYKDREKVEVSVKQTEIQTVKKKKKVSVSSRKTSDKKGQAGLEHPAVQEKEIPEEVSTELKDSGGTVPPEFMEILDKLVKERMRTLHTGEERFKRLDERIRICQKSRKEVAAAMEKERIENKKRFRKKQR